MFRNYPRIRAVQSRLLSEDYTLRREKSSLRPQLSLSLRGGEERFTNSDGYQILGETGTASLQGSQLLYDGGYTRNRVREAEAYYRVQSATLEQAKQDMALDLAVTYVDILKYQRLLRYAEDNVALHRQSLSKIDKKFKAGAGPKADVTLVQGRLAMAEATRATRERQLKSSQTAFLKLTGQFPVALTEPEFPSWALPDSLDEVDFASNPLVQKAREELNAALATERAAKGAYAPKLSFIVEADEVESDRYSSLQEDALAAISLSYNVFDGGKSRSDKLRSKALVDEADWKLQQIVLDVENDFIDAWNELLSHDERIFLLESHRDAIASVAHAYHEQFELGKRPLINLLDIENELFSSKSSVEEERYNRIQAVYRLLAAKGDLLTTIQ